MKEDGIDKEGTVRLPEATSFAVAVAEALRSKATWLLAAVWIAAVAVTASAPAGGPLALRSAVRMALAVALSLATLWITLPRAAQAAPEERGKAPAQAAAVLALAALIVALGLLLPSRGMGAVSSLAFGWTKLVIVPAALLLALGARPGDLGLRRGEGTGRVAALWGIPILALLVLRLASGRLGIGGLVQLALSHLLQAGLPEEFFYRGALQSRLARLSGAGWGLALQALVFAAVHAPRAAERMNAGPLAGAAAAFAMFVPMGLALGVVFARTRSLAAPCLVHVGTNLIADAV